MTVRRRSDVEVVDVTLVVEGSTVGFAAGSVGPAGRAGHRVPEGVLHVEVIEVIDAGSGLRDGGHARQDHTAR